MLPLTPSSPINNNNNSNNNNSNNNLWSEFMLFLRQNRIVELGIAFVCGRAFNFLLKSLVNDVLVGPMGMLIVGDRLVNRFLILKSPPSPTPLTPLTTPRNTKYRTLEDAQRAGAVTLNYGKFGQNLINFLVVCLSLFLFHRLLRRIFPNPPPPSTPSTASSSSSTTSTTATAIDETVGRAKRPTSAGLKRCMYCYEMVNDCAIKCRYCHSSLSARIQTTR